MSFKIDSYLEGQEIGDVILHHKGNVDSDFINSVLDLVEKKMHEYDEQPKLKKKVYNVLVETLQNLFHHVDAVPEGFSESDAERFGLLLVSRTGEGYRIITGNFIHNDKIEKLEEKIKRINRSSKEEIKELYKFILNHQKISEKGGGGLGLVDIARKTGNNLTYRFEGFNGTQSFFYLDILVSEEVEST
ncbi:MAG: hypothetical protein FJY11_02780 [Bacteroidetes bacterium]|nr:hypothetical protein [Bacteroidota bacterium]